MAMAAINMVSARRFSGVSFHLRRCPQGVATVLCKKTPIFWVPTIKVRPPDGTEYHKKNLSGRNRVKSGRKSASAR